MKLFTIPTSGTLCSPVPIALGIIFIAYLLAMGPAQYWIYDSVDYDNDNLRGTIYTVTPEHSQSREPRFRCSVYHPVLWACTQSEVIYYATDAWLRVWGSSLGHIADGQSKGIILTGYVSPYVYTFGSSSTLDSVPEATIFSGEIHLTLGIDLNYQLTEKLDPYDVPFHRSPWDIHYEEKWNSRAALYYRIVAEIKQATDGTRKEVEAQLEKEQFMKARPEFPQPRIPLLNPWTISPSMSGGTLHEP